MPLIFYFMKLLIVGVLAATFLLCSFSLSEILLRGFLRTDFSLSDFVARLIVVLFSNF